MNFDTVSYLHLRNVTPEGEIMSRGGTTVAFRETQPGVVEFAEAWCSPADNFNKAYGRTKATGRLNSPRFRRVAQGVDLVQFRRDVMSGDIL
jgi:hypothetical protein